MSDSSSEEDLSRFQDVVDNTFIKSFNPKTRIGITDQKLRSERYLEEAGHYNDVKVSNELQKRIGAKVSEIINRNLMFIDVEAPILKRKTVEGGVKLFRDSEGLLSCEAVIDTSTVRHNQLARSRRKRKCLMDEEALDEIDKVKSVAVSGEHVLLQDDTKYWKSRRKEKIYKYRRSSSHGNVLMAAECSN
ncbi:PREDICTED: uncharacterized protein LOC106109057 [Papilio polytes]|uniref:uncharacterized protein LOC106109057 n=1 Tax=Papilio polytes TaxID=76194 RepID=UPI000676962D|nr:PREDICTED: uncharacterized protein LOC106109057 [Papilio polytes]